MKRYDFEKELRAAVANFNAHAQDLRWQALIPFDIDTPTGLLCVRPATQHYAMHNFDHKVITAVKPGDLHKLFSTTALAMIQSLPK